MVQKTYIIQSDTLAILPAKQIEYASIIIEKNQTLHIQQTPLEIMKNSCYTDWTTYEGRRKAVIYHMHYTHKVPIPVCLKNQLHFFPTHSPTNIHNNWIAAHHIAYITRINKQQATIQFTSGFELTLDVSSYTLHQQKNRAYACMYKNRQTT